MMNKDGNEAEVLSVRPEIETLLVAKFFYNDFCHTGFDICAVSKRSVVPAVSSYTSTNWRARQKFPLAKQQLVHFRIGLDEQLRRLRGHRFCRGA
jgi:hypothetical protein